MFITKVVISILMTMMVVALMMMKLVLVVERGMAGRWKVFGYTPSSQLFRP